MELNDFNLKDLVQPINLKGVKNIPNYLESYKGEVVGFTKNRVKVWFGNGIYNILPENLIQAGKLLPCPICGSQPKLSSLEPKYKSMKYFCSVHVSCGDWKITEELAAKDWNNRVREYLNQIEVKNK